MVLELFADELGTETVTLLVGPEMQKFVVHKQLLISRSTHFKAALTGGFKEGIENVIRLEEDDPAAIELIIQFLYTGTVPALDENSRDVDLQYRSLFVASRAFTPDTLSVVTDRENGHHGLDVDRERSLDGQLCIMDNLCTTPKFKTYSVEELRLADYEALAGRVLLDADANRTFRASQEKHFQDRLRRCAEVQEALFQATVLADIWCWKECHDALIKAFIDGEIILNSSQVPLQYIKLAYDSLCAGSPLRKLVFDLVDLEIRESGFPEKRRVQLVTRTHDDFVIDLLGRDMSVASFMAATQFRARVEEGYYYLKELKDSKGLQNLKE